MRRGIKTLIAIIFSVFFILSAVTLVFALDDNYFQNLKWEFREVGHVNVRVDGKFYIKFEDSGVIIEINADVINLNNDLVLIYENGTDKMTWYQDYATDKTNGWFPHTIASDGKEYQVGDPYDDNGLMDDYKDSKVESNFNRSKIVIKKFGPNDDLTKYFTINGTLSISKDDVVSALTNAGVTNIDEALEQIFPGKSVDIYDGKEYFQYSIDGYHPEINYCTNGKEPGDNTAIHSGYDFKVNILKYYQPGENVVVIPSIKFAVSKKLAKESSAKAPSQAFEFELEMKVNNKDVDLGADAVKKINVGQTATWGPFFDLAVGDTVSYSIKEIGEMPTDWSRVTLDDISISTPIYNTTPVYIEKIFENKYTKLDPQQNYGKLFVKKIVDEYADGDDENTKFSFTVTYSGGIEKDVFTLNNGEPWTSKPLPAGTEFTIIESPNNKYDTIYSPSKDGKGEIPDIDESIVGFTVTNSSNEVIDPPPPPDKYGQLVVKKVVSSYAEGDNNNTKFTFSISFNGNEETYFELANGGSKTFSDLPIDTKYTVKEITNSKYTTQYSVNNINGNIANESTVVLTVTNTAIRINPDPDPDPKPEDNYGSIYITKQVNSFYGSDNGSKEFQFYIEFYDKSLNKTTRSFSLKAGETREFAGILVGTSYRIEEIEPNYAVEYISSNSGVVQTSTTYIVAKNTAITNPTPTPPINPTPTQPITPNPTPTPTPVTPSPTPTPTPVTPTPTPTPVTPSPTPTQPPVTPTPPPIVGGATDPDPYPRPEPSRPSNPGESPRTGDNSRLIIMYLTAVSGIALMLMLRKTRKA